MNILLCGADGYIGWALGHRLVAAGHKVVGVDNFSRRSLVREMGSDSAIPIATVSAREDGGPFPIVSIDIAQEYGRLARLLDDNVWHAIIDLAEQPSAAWSMRGPGECRETNENNTSGTLNLLWLMRQYAPDAHLLKLGTMGEYGTPNIEISEGEMEIDFRGRSDRLPFPRRPGSFYHGSKCADSIYVEMACRFWGLKSTDVMQGVVYGSRGHFDAPSALEQTRVDIDECFGTVVHRFCSQVIAGVPMTIYGEGGQTRGYLPLRDSLSCLVIALNNPPSAGEYRVFNQLDRCYSVAEIADTVRRAAHELNLDARAENISNPRHEKEDHFYKPEAEALRRLGYEPTGTLEEDCRQILSDMLPHAERIRALVKPPGINWRR